MAESYCNLLAATAWAGTAIVPDPQRGCHSAGSWVEILSASAAGIRSAWVVGIQFA